MRNKLLSIIACIVVAVVTIISCDKKKDILKAPAYAEFATPLVSNIKYFVKNDPNSQFKIPIGITNISNVDRKIIIKDSSRKAVNGTQYTIESTTITIPAGKAADSIVLKGIYAGYPVGRVDTLFLKIVGGDVPANAYNATYSVILQGYCDVVPADLVGDYTQVTDNITGYGSSPQGPYTATISEWTSTGTNTATVKIQNLGATSDYGFGDVDPNAPGFLPGDPAATGLIASLDWNNPSNFSVTIAKQTYVLDSYGNGPSTITGSGSFSSCAGTFTITFKVADAAAPNGYTAVTSIFKR